MMAAETLHLKEQKTRELDESHTADLTALSDKHAVEIAAQLSAYQQDLTERDERAQCQVIAYKKRSDAILYYLICSSSYSPSASWHLLR